MLKDIQNMFMFHQLLFNAMIGASTMRELYTIDLALVFAKFQLYVNRNSAISQQNYSDLIWLFI